MQPCISRLRVLPLVALLAMLWGCQTTVPLEQEAQPLPDDPRVIRAAELIEAGEYLSAAALYEAAVADAPPEVRTRLRLLAADLYLAGGNYDRVRQLVATLPTTGTTASDDLHRRILLAELALHDGNTDDALNLLIELPGADVDPELEKRYHRISAQAFRMAGNIYESARELQALDLLLVDEARRFEVQRDILRNLSALNSTMLSLLRPATPNDEAGWIDLAGLIKSYRSQPSVLAEKLAAWRTTYPEHPALQPLLEEFVSGTLVPTQLAQHIAVLLPETGAYAGVAAAIRDGLLAAWYQAEPPRPQLRFYDSSDPTSAWLLYTDAVANGAQMVIGPLDKSAVVQFVRAGELPVPVLALNQVEDDTAPPQNLFQFSLAPEDEARQVAEKAWSEGLRRPILLAPDTSWGTRIMEAFRERWHGLGGEIADWRDYKRGTVDFSDSIRGMLHLDRSESRNRALARTLGTRLQFEPRRRADVDFVFVAAKLRDARQIRPQLQFHHAGDLPVYATSHVWGGSIDANEARDVAGIRVPDMPWLVTPDPESPLSRERLIPLFPASATGYARLYAMGLDTFRLLTNLARLQQSTLESMDGSSGNLYLNRLNQVQRQLVWVELAEKPVILGYSPRLDVQYSPTHGLEGEPIRAVPAGDLAPPGEPVPPDGSPRQDI